MAGAGSTLGKPKKSQGKSADKAAHSKGTVATAATTRSPDAGTSRAKMGLFSGKGGRHPPPPPPPKAESLPAAKTDETSKEDAAEKGKPLKAPEKTAPEPVGTPKDAAKAAEGVPLKTINSKTQLDKFIKEAGERLVVIFFSGTWCETCQTLKPIMRELAQVNSTVVFFCEVNVDDSEDTAEACDIVHIPTFQFYKLGKKVAEVLDDNRESVADKIKELK